MRLPRWLLVTLIALSGVALVAVPAWLWVEMPKWTAEKFIAAVEAEDVAVANKLLVDATVGFQTYEIYPPFLAIIFSTKSGKVGANMRSHEIVMVRRGLRDLLTGEQRLVFRANGRDTRLTMCATWRHLTSDAEEHVAALRSGASPFVD